MKYIIMCGGIYPDWETPRHLTVINGETLVARTIRLLKRNGIDDIAITAYDERFSRFGVPVLHHENNYGKGGRWIEAFIRTDYPVCYLYGDVFYSEKAIKKIVGTKTRSVEFFASSPPFSPQYIKDWAEPFAFKVQDPFYFQHRLDYAVELENAGKLNRLISWELWQVIKGTPLNDINYNNYTAINDYTCDIDDPEDVEKLLRVLI